MIFSENHIIYYVSYFLFFPFKEKVEQNDDPEEVNYGIQPAAVANEMEFLRNFMSLDESERILIGHDFKSFIKGCTFRGKNCLTET